MLFQLGLGVIAKFDLRVCVAQVIGHLPIFFKAAFSGKRKKKGYTCTCIFPIYKLIHVVSKLSFRKDNWLALISNILKQEYINGPMFQSMFKDRECQLENSKVYSAVAQSLLELLSD